MGPIAIGITVAAGLLGVFLAVMAYRGLIDDLSPRVGESCQTCHRATLLPLPPVQTCWRCRHQGLQRAAARVHVHHEAAGHPH